MEGTVHRDVGLLDVDCTDPALTIPLVLFG